MWSVVSSVRGNGRSGSKLAAQSRYAAALRFQHRIFLILSIPAKAGLQSPKWIPAFGGITIIFQA